MCLPLRQAIDHTALVNILAECSPARKILCPLGFLIVLFLRSLVLGSETWKRRREKRSVVWKREKKNNPSVCLGIFIVLIVDRKLTKRRKGSSDLKAFKY